MNIAIISECYPSTARPQYGVFIEQQAMALQKMGHNVVVIKPNLSGKLDADQNFNGIEVRNFSLPRRRTDRLYCNMKARLKKKEINWREFDVVSIHIVSMPIAEAIVAECKQCQVPSVIHFHGLNVWSDYYGHKDLYHRVQRLFFNKRKLDMLKAATAVVGVSQSVCDIVHERLHQDNVYLVYNGVDTSLFTPAEKVNDGTFKMLCVANLIPIKGHRYLIQAVRNLVDSGYKVRLDLIGMGPDENELRELVWNLKLDSNVVFHGSKPYATVAEMMQETDMFIMPSFYDSFGCVYVEAMSTGTVTCGCDVFGPKEIIEDGISGLLVKPRDADSIVAAVKKVIEDPALRNQIEQNAIKRAKRFSWAQSAVDLIDVYQKYV